MMGSLFSVFGRVYFFVCSEDADFAVFSLGAIVFFVATHVTSTGWLHVGKGFWRRCELSTVVAGRVISFGNRNQLFQQILLSLHQSP